VTVVLDDLDVIRGEILALPLLPLSAFWSAVIFDMWACQFLVLWTFLLFRSCASQARFLSCGDANLSDCEIVKL
jgi:hypothetical protein